MAVLSDADRAEVTQEFMAQATGPITCLKADIRPCVNALDDYYNANAATINQALPLPGRTALTLADKALMDTLVKNKRYIKNP